MNYAILEAIQGEMRRDELLTLLYEYQGTAARRRGKSVDLGAEFGPPRVQFCPIDEEWIVGGALGMSLIGVRAIARIPSMATFIPFELMFNHAGKLRHMTGGQATMPMVLWADMARRWARLSDARILATGECCRTTAVSTSALRTSCSFCKSLCSPRRAV